MKLKKKKRKQKEKLVLWALQEAAVATDAFPTQRLSDRLSARRSKLVLPLSRNRNFPLAIFQFWLHTKPEQKECQVIFLNTPRGIHDLDTKHKSCENIDKRTWAYLATGKSSAMSGK